MLPPLSRAVALACAGAVVPVFAQAQQSAATITGRVTGDGGQPLPAISVFIPTLNYGTTTRPDGTFSFTVPANRVTGQTVGLTARGVGFRAQTVQVTLRGGTITQNFALVTAPAQLSAVVITGAGTTTTAERLGAAVTRVDTNALKRANEPANVVSALTAKAPNVEIRTQSGEPGSSASIRIRGASSVLGTNQPLFVVDNQPIDNSANSTQGGNQSTVTQNRAADLNPNDIESVQILKGAAASALYGARAANGVVLITTKRGRAGQTRYTLQSSATADRIDPRLDLQRRFGQGNDGVDATCVGFDCTPRAAGRAAVGAFGAEIPAGTPTFDHLDEVFDTGTTFDNNLSVSGGSERTTFFLSGGLMRQDGYMKGPNNAYNRTSVRLRANHQMTSSLNLGGNFSYIDTRGNFVQKGSNTSGLLLGALRTPPSFDNRQYLSPTTGLHRSYRFPNPSFGSTTRGRGYDNPFFTLQNPGNTSELGRFIGNVSADYNPTSWLKVNYTLGADSYADSRLEALPLTSSSRAIGQVARFEITNLEIDHNLLVTATREFSPNLTLRGSVGQNLNSRRNRQVFTQGNGLNAPAPLALQNTLQYLQPTEFRSLRHIEGYFGQAEADLYNQVFVTARVRNDGYSTFGETNRRAWYPAFTASWLFSTFLGNTEQTGLLSYGKLRAAYGEVGREPPVYATINAFSSTAQFGSGFGDAITASQGGAAGLVTAFTRGNAGLKPERNRETEVGADLGFFNQKVDLAVTYYDKKSSDVIMQVPVNAAQTGYLNQLANAATISNKGVELQLNARILDRPLVGWEVGMQYGRNKGRVLNLAGADFVSYNTEGFTGAIGSSTVGYAPGVLRGQDFARCGLGLKFDYNGDTVIDDIDALCGAGAKSGALFLAPNGLPVADPTDRVIADPNPRWTGGLSSTLRLGRKLRLSGLLDTRQGFQVWNGTRGILYNFGTHGDTEVRTQQGRIGRGGNWLTNEDVAGPGINTVPFTSVADWQAWFNGNGGGFGSVSKQFVEDGSFVKLRELSASYTLDQPWVRTRLGLSSLDVRLAGRNLFTWTDYKGLDPEANLGGSEFFTQGLDYFNNPQARSFVISLTLNR